MTDAGPKLLLIESSGTAGFVAIAVGPALWGVRWLEPDRRHCRDLAPAVRSLLLAQGWKAGELDGIVVSLGPGSYTGLRVGLMSAKTFAHVLKKPLVGVPTFEIIALQAAERFQRVAVIADAQQDRVYVQRFALKPGQLPIADTLLELRDGAAWRSTLPMSLPLSGPGLAQQKAKVQSGQPLLPPPLRLPQAPALLRLGLDRWTSGRYEDPVTLEPLYLRPSSAEEKWEALGK